ncbi:hypothetical protein HGRIS_010336 [Hohenbuehelia grisea]|uniref:Uncharacterized protein n=1 Tax=Hohenbuehelia grisea TaxID=104357 RepID=A0ABR3J407_9AGAR
MTTSRSNALPGLSRFASRSSQASSSMMTLSTSSASMYTATTTRTVYGIGSTTGRAIHALGKTVLRGVEAVAIGLRLTVIESRLKVASKLKAPPTTEDMKMLQPMYIDLLELSRAGLYERSYQERALKLLLKQIRSYDVFILASVIASLADTQPEELRSIIAEFLFVHELDWGLEFRDTYGRSPNPHRFTEPDEFYSAWAPQKHVPLICLLNHAISVNSSVCRVILEAGFLDALYTVLSRPGFYGNDIRSAGMNMGTHFLNACAVSFVAITAYPEHRRVLAEHLILGLWQDAVGQKRDYVTLTSKYSSHVNPSLGNADRDDFSDDDSLYRLVSLDYFVFRLSSESTLLKPSPLDTFLDESPRRVQLAFFDRILTRVYDTLSSDELVLMADLPSIPLPSRDRYLKFQEELLLLLYLLTTCFKYKDVLVTVGLEAFLTEILERALGVKLRGVFLPYWQDYDSTFMKLREPLCPCGSNSLSSPQALSFHSRVYIAVLEVFSTFWPESAG